MNNKNIKKMIQKYQNTDSKLDNFIFKIFQKEFNNYCKSLFLHMVYKCNNYNSKGFVINIINWVNYILQTDLDYMIVENEVDSIKVKNIFITIPKSHKINDDILGLISNISCNRLLDYILYLDREINDLKHNQKIFYPFLNKYESSTDYNILLHYSNMVE